MKTATQLERAWKRFRGTFAAFMARLDRDDVPYLSHSKVAEYQRCPRCYYRQYYDEYRLVNNLATIRQPAFRRTRVEVDHRLLPRLIRRYRAAWRGMRRCANRGATPPPAPDCWRCRNAWF